MGTFSKPSVPALPRMEPSRNPKNLFEGSRVSGRLTVWACWAGLAFSVVILATRVAGVNGLRLCDCSGATLVMPTLWALLPPIAGIAYFKLQLLALWKARFWSVLAPGSTVVGMPLGVIALDSMAKNGVFCPLCLGVWGCFTIVAVTTLRELVVCKPARVAVPVLVAVSLFLSGGMVAAQFGCAPAKPRTNPNCIEKDCCKTGCDPALGGSILYLINGYEVCRDQNGQGCLWKTCPARWYFRPGCKGEWEDNSYTAKCCDWRVVEG